MNENIEKPSANEQQQAAIDSRQAGAVVVAGPGSGKTTTIIERLRGLLESCEPERICVVTFTNSAAREIEKRLSWSKPGVKLGYVGTIHGLMLRYIQEYGRYAGVPQKLAVMDEDQSAALVADVMAELRLKCTKTSVKEAMKDAARLAQAAKESFLSNLTDPERVVVAYHQRCLREGMIDFDSILIYGIAVLRAIGITKTWGHVLWDEFQDSGLEDWEIYSLIQADAKYVVGDPDQSIYGWRGAKPEQFTNFARKAEQDGRLFRLEANFRSGHEICAVANRLIKHNQNRIEKQTVPLPTAGAGEVSFRYYSRDAEEISAIAADIQERNNVRECAVLVRTNALLAKYRLLLKGLGVPVSIDAPFDRPQTFERMMLFLALQASPGDWLAERYLTVTKGKQGAQAARREAARAFRKLSDYVVGLQPWDPANLATSLASQGVDAEAIDMAVAAVSMLPADFSLPELIAELNHSASHHDGDSPIVHTSTIHGAKGLEWDHVYLPAFEEGIIPSASKSADIEEERRLAFVAVTRARRTVWISHCGSRPPQFGGNRPEQAFPSRFWTEMRPEMKM